MDLRLPNITAKTEREQIEQIKSYLYQFVSQLQWILESMGQGEGSAGADVRSIASALKPLMIEASDIVNAYYEQMKPGLKRDFATRKEFSEEKEKVSSLEKRIEDGEKVTGRLGDFFYVPIRVSGTEFHIITSAGEQSVFIFGGGIYGNVYVSSDGTAAFSGSEGVSSVSIADGKITVVLSAAADTVFSAFSAFEFDIFQEG